MRLDLERCGIFPETDLLVALSGGADSVAMLHMLTMASREGRIGRIVAAHLHHGIRGVEADRDLAFCEKLCADWDVPFVSRKADVPAAARESGESLETAARRVRYAFLNDTAEKEELDLIATAHHMDDQAETLLMHLLRGSGTDGLAGIRARSGNLVRPMLGFRHRELCAYLMECGITWVEDSTNLEGSAERNRVRLELIPMLETYNKNVVSNLARTAQIVSGDVEALDTMARTVLKRAQTEEGFDRNILLEEDAAVRRRALKRLLEEAHLPEGLVFSDVDRVDALLGLQSGSRVTLRGGVEAILEGNVLSVGRHYEMEPFAIRFCRDGDTLFPGGRFSACLSEFRKPADGMEAYIDYEALPEDAVVRTRLMGDRFFPLGGPGMRNLSDVMTDRKIPLSKRKIPLLCSRDEVLWMPGYTVSEHLRVTSRTERVLYIRYYQEGDLS